AGRRQDFYRLVQQLPPSFADGAALLRALVSDNHTLGDLAVHSDELVTQFANQRPELVSLIRSAGQAATTFAQRQAALRATLARAPAALSTLRGFLTGLQATTIPLGPAAHYLAVSAAPLDSALAAVPAFRTNALPALAEAQAVAPKLTQLALGAAPVVRQLAGTATSLAQMSQRLQPVSTILNHSVDNLIATAANWGHAVQERDGLGHYFRGETALSPDLIQSIIRHLAPSLSTGPAKRRTSRPRAAVTPVLSHPAPTAAPPPPAATGGGLVGGLGAGLRGLLGGLLQPVGGVLTGQGHRGPPPAPGTAGSPAPGLKGLLQYLLGR